MPDLIQIPQDGLATAWPWLQERIAIGIEKSDDRMTETGLYAKADSGEYDIHIVYADDGEAGKEEHGPERVLAVLFTQLYREMGGDQVCAIRFLAGKNLVEWTWLINALELWALKNNCSMMSFVTRRGIARELKDFDYRSTAVLVEKRLKPKATGHAGTARTNGAGDAEHRPGRESAVPEHLHAGG